MDFCSNSHSSALAYELSLSSCAAKMCKISYTLFIDRFEKAFAQYEAALKKTSEEQKKADDDAERAELAKKSESFRARRGRSF